MKQEPKPSVGIGVHQNQVPGMRMAIGEEMVVRYPSQAEAPCPLRGALLSVGVARDRVKDAVVNDGVSLGPCRQGDRSIPP